MEPNGESTTAQAADASRDVAAPAAEGETGTNGNNGQTAETPPGAAETPVAEAVAEAPAPAAPAEQPAAEEPAAAPAAEEPAAAPAAEAPAAEAPAAVTPAAEAPAAETPAPDAVADAPAPAPPGDAPAETPAVAVTPDAERPAVGPRILGVAAEPKPLPTVKATLPKPKRRRRPSAAERHRRAFFSALTDLRRGGTMPTAAPAEQAASADETAPAEAEATAAESPAVEPPAVEPPAVEPPAVEAPATETEAAPAAEEPAAPGTDRSPTSPARVIAAIERVGGAEVIKEALKPKQDEKGQPLKWAAVCAQSAEGMKPGDPVFNAWVRLAATPVREVKGLLPRPPEAERSERGPGGRRPGQQRSGGGRPRRDDRPNRSEYASHAQDGKLRTSIRIITGHDEDQERRERERNRKEQREAKRRAERERLARLGY